MFYSPNVSPIKSWSRTDQNKKWLVFTYIKTYLQTKYKLINPKLDQIIQNFSPAITHPFFVIGYIDLNNKVMLHINDPQNFDWDLRFYS